MLWWEYLLLAVASIFWPLLFAIVLVALRTAHPARVLGAFLAAGLLTTTAVGCAIVFGIAGADTFSRSSTTGRPIAYLLAGLAALAAARVVASRPPKPPSDDHALERYVSSVPLALGAGVVLNLFPGVFPLVALMNIAQTGYEPPVQALLVAVFYVIMFISVEAPLVGYGLAPERTAAVVARLNDRVTRNGRRVASWILAAVGVYLLARGVVVYA